MKTFKEYLQGKVYAPSSVGEHLYNVVLFLKEGKELFEYLKGLQSQGLKASTINLRLCSIEQYYDYKGGENPAKGVRVKNLYKKFTTIFFTPKELETIYESYTNRNYLNRPTDKASQQRNTVLLGLIIYQGLSSSDLQQLEAKHLDLEKGIIEVPSSLRSNSRKLKLEAVQIIPIQNYITELSHCRIAKLFPDLHNSLTLLLKQLKKMNPKLKNIRELRQSRISHWIKQYPIREVQYRCGFRHISTVQNYQQQDIESLQNAVQQYHPMK